MKVRVKYTAQLRTALGRGEDEVDLPDGSTAATLLTHLITRHDEQARMHLLSPGGELLQSLLLVVNDEAKLMHQVAELRLNAGDVVVLLPPIAGG
jgi:MoaD family protein